MEADLRQLMSTIQDTHLRALLDRVLGGHTETWRAYRRAPAAKHYHQAYPHGLLEHSLSVALGVHALAASFPGIDHDVAVTGALLHDIGKLDAYTTDPPAIDLTDAGRLHGEIALGYYRIRRAIEELPGFPPERAQALLHVILSHHGALAHGSPVVPCTREATLVHHIDSLGGRLGSFDRLERELPPGASWTPFDRGIGASAYFGPAAAEQRRAASGGALAEVDQRVVLDAEALVDEARGNRVSRLPALAGPAVEPLEGRGGQPERALDRRVVVRRCVFLGHVILSEPKWFARWSWYGLTTRSASRPARGP
jgi:3'-5' exoribonuclease